MVKETKNLLKYLDDHNFKKTKKMVMEAIGMEQAEWYIKGCNDCKKKS